MHSTPTNCHKCQASIPDGQDACICCGEPVRREGLLHRFVKWLLQRGIRSGAVKIKEFEWESPPVVERHVFKSLDDVPPELAAKIERARQGGSTVIEFRDDTTGDQRTFRSWDEVPEEMKRKLPPEIREAMAGKLEGGLLNDGGLEAASDNIVVQEATGSRVLDVKIEGMRFR